MTKVTLILWIVIMQPNTDPVLQMQERQVSSKIACMTEIQKEIDKKGQIVIQGECKEPSPKGTKEST